jgi:DnaK suppressor protein
MAAPAVQTLHATGAFSFASEPVIVNWKHRVPIVTKNRWDRVNIQSQPELREMIMASAKLKRYSDRLVDARRELVRELDHVMEVIPEEVHPAGEHEIAPSEGIDLEMSLESEERRRLREIDDALERVRLGTYGKCCECGQEISDARLEVIPYARFCIRCGR